MNTDTSTDPAGHLSYELDDLNKDVEGRVSGNNTPRAFGEQRGNDIEKPTGARKEII